MRKNVLAIGIICATLAACTPYNIDGNDKGSNNVEVELTDDKNGFDNNDDLNDNDDSNYIEDATSERPEIINEVPDYIANRGIIIGAKYCINANDYSFEDVFGKYKCDCNLAIESSDLELGRFAEEFKGEDGKIEYFTNKDGDRVSALIRSITKGIQIFRSDKFQEDLRNGYVYFEDDPGYYVPAYYDPTGKFVFLDNSFGDDLINFLEPEMVRVSVKSDYVDIEAINSDNEAVIEKYKEALHNLDVTATEENPDEIVKDKDTTVISFTTSEGAVHDYCFVEDKYLVCNNTVYEVNNYKILSIALGTEYTSDFESQLTLIEDQYDVWGKDRAKSDYYLNLCKIAITDLNRNGRLEIILSVCEGSGVFSTTEVYEVDESYSSLKMLENDDENNQDDIGDFQNYDTLSCYKKGGSYYYAIEDYYSTGFPQKGSSLHSYNFDDRFECDLIAGFVLAPEGIVVDDKVVDVKLYDGNNNTLKSEEEFNKVIADYWEDYEKQPDVAVKWVSFPTKDICHESIKDSYEGYNENSNEECEPLTDYKTVYGEYYEYLIVTE